MAQNTFPWRSLAALTLLLPVVAGSAALAAPETDAPRGLLETIHRHVTLTSTIPDNGDLNPYAVVVAPVDAGKIKKDDVLVDNFNNISNLQGTGGTIVSYSPAGKKTALFAKLPQHLAECPGGVGLSTAMTMLKSGWVIVGSAPSTDGTTRTKGNGCLIVLDPQGEIATTWSGPDINMPWGNIALVDNGDKASLFVSMAGFEVPAPDVLDPATGFPVTVRKATVLRLDLAIAEGKPPEITGRTVVADGLSHRADQDVFLIGPTGLALSSDAKTLYLSDALENRIVAITEPLTRTTSAQTGETITRDGLMQRPLALAITPAGHLLATNAKNGQVVEIDPIAKKQLYAHWIVTDQAQSPPGNGDLFGIAMKPDGTGFYYVADDVNTLVEATR